MSIFYDNYGVMIPVFLNMPVILEKLTNQMEVK